MPLKLTTYYRGSEIPDLPGKNTFHSKELFLIYEATPGYKPVFIVATENGKPIARLLAGIRTNKKLFPPSIVRRCEVYGTGEYLSDEDTDHIRRNVGAPHHRSFTRLFYDRIP